jgi:anti-sigma regulatory factor (Ser/Thr protein kinase)
VLEISYPAVASSVAAARAATGDIAEAHGASSETVESIRLAVSESVTNAVQHAYPDGDGHVHLTAAVLVGTMLIAVADDGRGMASDYDSPGLGFGLPLIAAHSDRCAVVSSPRGGVQVEMRFDLHDAGVATLAA